MGAAAYYEKRLSDLSLDITMPDVLGDDAHRLSAAGEALSIENPDPEMIGEMTDKLDELVAPLGAFVWAAVRTEFGTPRRVNVPQQARNRAALARIFTDDLNPDRLTTGQLRGITVEAVAQDHLTGSSRRRIRKDGLRGVPDDPDARTKTTELTEASLVVSALRTSGSRRQTAASLLVVRAVPLLGSDRHISVHYATAALQPRDIVVPLSGDGLRAAHPATAPRSTQSGPLSKRARSTYGRVAT